MTDTSIVRRYLTAMQAADGTRAAALFTPDGVLDDYRGGHRVGRDVIREYLNARPFRTIDFLTDVIAEGPRMTAYAEMNYDDGRGRRLVRFVFTVDGGAIAHLCNSSVEFVPDDLRIDPPVRL
jgi:ketosteroid isomerase-like protein